jgi:hypothetical protein
MIDLKALCATRYRTTWEEPATPTGGVPDDQRWLYVRVRCRYGHIGVWGRDQLYAFTDRPRIRTKLLAIPGVVAKQTGDQEVNATFPTDRLDQVCDVLGAYRRPAFSAETLARKRTAMIRAREHLARQEPDTDAPDGAPLAARRAGR